MSVRRYMTNPRLVSSIAVTVGFFDVDGSTLRAPLCSWRALLAATIIKRYVLKSPSSGITFAGVLTVLSAIAVSLTYV
jgi:hypothetical protein